jgi:hypothetical protein
MKLMIDTGANRRVISWKAWKSNRNRSNHEHTQRSVYLADDQTSILSHGETNLSIVVCNIYMSIQVLIV